MPTVVVAVEVLLPGVLSLGDETVAVLMIVPGVLGAVTTIVSVAALPPDAMLPVRVQVAVPDTLVQDQFVPVPLTNVVPAGRVSTTWTLVAGAGPALWTPIV